MAIISRELGIKPVSVKSDPATTEEAKTWFSVKILSAKEASEMQDTIAKQASGSLVYSCVEKALVGWKNFQDASGNQIAFDKKNQKNNLDLLNLGVMAELAEEILRLSFPDTEGELEKN